MIISRRAFLATTTAFTTINMYFPMASAEIDSQSLQRDRWHSVWYQPMDKLARQIGKFTGLEKYDLPASTFLKLDHADMMKIRAARPGQGFKQEATTHFVPPRDGAWG